MFSRIIQPTFVAMSGEIGAVGIDDMTRSSAALALRLRASALRSAAENPVLLGQALCNELAEVPKSPFGLVDLGR